MAFPFGVNTMNLNFLDEKFIDKLTTMGFEWGVNISLAIIIFIIGRIIVSIVGRVTERVLVKAKVDPLLVEFITGIVKTILLVFVIIAALEKVGVQTTSLVAVLGAAGLAIGLALQGSLQNFASGVLLIVLRPFAVGHFVEVAGVNGVVERVTLFSTVLRTGDNREVTVPNGSIYGNVITNFSARDTRRVDMTFGIGYEDDVQKAKAILADLLANDERVLKDPAPLIAVGQLADSSVNIVVRPWVKTADYWPLNFDMQERVKAAFDEAGISIPYPQMDIHTKKAS